ncbi:MAG: type II secretion system protein [Bacilli bacterium]
MKLNNKGFTLIELLGVIIILMAILYLAIPSLTSSVERSKRKQFEQKKELIISAGELYISDIKTTKRKCKITLDKLKNEDYLSGITIINPFNDKEEIKGEVIYNKDSADIYTFCMDNECDNYKDIEEC